ncbi:MAG: transglutaminase domain-containing protein [Planctomycetes bacterium]|nr:transglutaminase domain-containing protein [Planctomycetota bacterium]
MSATHQTRVRISAPGLFLFHCLWIPASGADPAIDIARECRELVPLYKELPPNECLVGALAYRESDGLILGATCGRKTICVFSYDHRSSKVALLDRMEALWCDEPRLALGPEGDVYLGARRAYDKQFVFERSRERPHVPGSYKRRGGEPPPGEINEEAPGVPIRHYSRAGKLLGEIALPESLAKDGAGALAVCAGGKFLCGLSSPGGRLFTVALSTGEKKDHGEVVNFPERLHTRPISKALIPGGDGKVYFCGTTAGDNSLHSLDPATGKLEKLDLRLPAVPGREPFAALEAFVELASGGFLGGTSDGYLFLFDPGERNLEIFGKPLRQHRIVGLAMGADGLVYGAGGEPGGLPRLFAFDPLRRRLHLGMSPSGNPPEEPPTFGEIGALAATAGGTLVCGERERRGYLLVYRPRLRKWKASTAGVDLGSCTRDRFVDLAGDGGGIQLAPTFLISDAMARSSKEREALGGSIYAKKIFRLHSPCAQAEILFFGGGGSKEAPMLLRVNGREILHVQDPEKMLTGLWDRESVPGDYLREGENELVFSRAGFLIVDADAPGGGSFKSRSLEGPWKADGLGTENRLAGEYAVRIRLRGHPPRGSLTSPPIDMARAAAGEKEGALDPTVRIEKLRLMAEATAPPGTSIELEARTGSSPEHLPEKWSDWHPASDLGKLPWKRFVQWRAILQSDDARLTPQLRSVTVEAEGEVSGANREHVRTTAAPDNQVAVSSYPFDYADPRHPRMRHLREKYQLEEVVAPGKTDEERFALLRQWVRRQWEGWNDSKYKYCPPWDALEILELAPANLGLGMCTHYAAVFTQCAAALGYQARMLIVDHHCLAEIWSDRHRKWILQDPGPMTGHAVTFQYESAGAPLNALELHQRSLAGSASDVAIVPDPPTSAAEMRQGMVRVYRRFAIPLRNDHLYRPEPQELEHGFDHYHWDGYLWWTDSLDPLYPEYSLQSSRPEDFYWTLNRTVILLEDTEKEGELAVQLSGPIPNLDRFLVRRDGGEWKKTEPAFSWKLAAGKNVLEAKAVNTMGREGPANRVELEYVR